MEIYELKKALTDFETRFEKLVKKIDLAQLNLELGVINESVNAPDFWNNPSKAASVTKKQQSLIKTIKITNDVEAEIDFFGLVIEENEPLDVLVDTYTTLSENFKAFEIETLLNQEYDNEDAIIEIHPGAGGTESQDWANMLFSMYTKFFNKKGYKFKIIDMQNGEVAGIKSVTIEVTGDKVYGMLKGENGIHRLVRISPFDSNAKRHTSFASVNVMPVVEEDTSIEINQSDLKIDVYRSGGAGGQSVNTTDSAVRITHLPTNIVVICQNERSQTQNKEQAMKVLLSRLVEMKIQEQREEKAKLQGEQLSNGWGSQKRSYVLHPYKMVKDHHTNFESSQAEKVLQGDMDDFLYHNLLI